MCLDLEAERALLAGGLQTTVEQLEPDFRHAVGRLPQRFGKAASTISLADCFSDLTLLYPVLIGEGLLPSSAQQARRVLVPHALLAVYAYLDDRRRDGQIEIESVETRLADWMVGEARRQLNLAIGATGNSDAFQVLLRIYAEAQATRASDPDQLPSLIVRRHLPGIVSAMSLLDANHCESTRIDRVGAGYRHLVLSLQWIDDLRDIEDDLATGADNLLLCRLPKDIRDEASLPDVIGCAHAMGLFVIALEEALTHVAAAREIASLLGCHTLAGLLERRQQWITDRDRQEVRSPFVRSPGL